MIGAWLGQWLGLWTGDSAAVVDQPIDTIVIPAEVLDGRDSPGAAAKHLPGPLFLGYIPEAQKPRQSTVRVVATTVQGPAALDRAPVRVRPAPRPVRPALSASFVRAGSFLSKPEKPQTLAQAASPRPSVSATVARRPGSLERHAPAAKEEQRVVYPVLRARTTKPR